MTTQEAFHNLNAASAGHRSAPPTPHAPAKRPAPAAGVTAPETLEAAISGRAALILLASIVFGALAAVALIPAGTRPMVQTIVNAAPVVFWHISRSTAFVALFFTWLSMIFGLLITGKVASKWPGATQTFELHQHASLLGLAFALIHVLILLGDRTLAFTLSQVIIPLAGESYTPIWFSVGQFSLYAMIILTLSYSVRKTISQPVWRAIHFASFLQFTLAVVHGFFRGSDSGNLAAQIGYGICVVSVVALTVYRVAVSLRARAAKAARPSRAVRSQPSQGFEPCEGQR